MGKQAQKPKKEEVKKRLEKGNNQHNANVVKIMKNLDNRSNSQSTKNDDKGE
jgi:hypothetical protein